MSVDQASGHSGHPGEEDSLTVQEPVQGADSSQGQAAATVVRIAEHVTRITVQLEGPPGDCHVYAISGSDGLTLVDAGFPSPMPRRALLDAVDALEVPVRRVLITHAHLDHWGQARTLQERFDCEVWLHREDWDIMVGEWESLDGPEHPFLNDLVRATLPPDVCRDYLMRCRLERPNVELPAAPSFAADRQRFSLGTTTLDVVWTPGHTPGHFCVYDDRSGFLFSGDHVLAGITPHVGGWGPAPAENPVHAFERSLAKVLALKVGVTHPAHREVVDDLPRRVEEILAHHRVRRDRILDILGEDELESGEVSGSLFPKFGPSSPRRPLDLNPLLALAETIAHLEALALEGVVRGRRARDGRVSWRRVDPSSSQAGGIGQVT